jgi:hypothetical protein
VTVRPTSWRCDADIGVTPRGRVQLRYSLFNPSLRGQGSPEQAARLIVIGLQVDRVAKRLNVWARKAP